MFTNKMISLVVAAVVTVLALAPVAAQAKEVQNAPTVTVRHGKFAGVVHRPAQQQERKQELRTANTLSVTVKHGKFAGVTRRAKREENTYASSN